MKHSRKPQASAPQQHLLFSIKKNVGFIRLNRPDALNSLNPGMMCSIRQRLLEWHENDDVHAIVVHSSSDKAFCAGGDLKAVYKAGTQKQVEVLENLFREEYLLNYVIKAYSKPYISFINGIAMGGGLGLSVHGSHRIMGENTVAAMPETKIGFFPDVGASAFLNRAPGKVGLYLALTGNTIKMADALYAKIGTHYIPHEKHAELLSDIKALKLKTLENLNTLIDSYAESNPVGGLQGNEEEIHAIFDAPTLDGIFKNLESATTDFATETLETLKERSPTSLAVTFELLKRGAEMTDFAEVMSMEFNLSQNFIKGTDFFEGIRAAVIEKDHKPKWSPKALGDLSPEDIEAYFEAHSTSLLS